MFQFLSRQPLSFVCAIGLVGVFKGFLTLHEDVMQIIQAYQIVTFYIWDSLFGWINIFNVVLPELVKQYLILGMIHSSASLGSYPSFKMYFNNVFLSQKAFIKSILFMVVIILIWPWFYYGSFIYWRHNKQQDRAVKDSLYYIETTKHMNEDERKIFNHKLKKHKNIKKQQMVFFEFLCWVLAIILFSYGLFFFKS